MTDDEKRAHDLALYATQNYYSHNNIVITDGNAFEAGIFYRSVYREFLHSIEEGHSDLK
ncbi:MAG: hypothetical protein ACLR6B_21835 [Blautia sp.]